MTVEYGGDVGYGGDRSDRAYVSIGGYGRDG